MDLSKKGFTLVEIMIVVVIIVVLAAFAIPEVRDAVPNYELRSLSHEVLSSAQKARSLAVQKNHRVRVHFDANGFELQEDTDNNGVFNGSDDGPFDRREFSEYGDARQGYANGVNSCGGSTMNWNGDVGAAVATVTDFIFTARGTVSPGSVYLDNGDADATKNTICYGITAIGTGSVKMRKYLECAEADKKKCWME